MIIGIPALIRLIMQSGKLLNVKTMAACAAALILSVSLAARGADTGYTTATAPVAAETKPPVDGGSFGTIEDLRDAAKDAGLDCQAWDVHNKYKYASSSAECGASNALAIFAHQSSLDTQLAVWKELGDLVELERLVGKNWTIDTDDPESLQKKMGGTVFRTSGK
jgi:hypothetical protein